MVISGPEDLLACVPILLGFVPTESVVMIALSPATGPHARIDLPEADADALVRALAEPALRNGVGEVAVVVYTELDRAAAYADLLPAEFRRWGVDVRILLAADGRRWLSRQPGMTTHRPREYDADAHALRARAVVEGHVVLGSRQELGAALAPEARLVEEVRAVLEEESRTLRLSRPRAGQVRAWVRTALARTQGPTPQDLARLALAAREAGLRDHLWGWVERAEAPAHVELWRLVVRSLPEDEAAEPAAVLAVLAWVAGSGALAWCALERSEAGGGCSLAMVVGELLTGAVSPRGWRGSVRGGRKPAARTDTSASVRGAGGAEVVDLALRRRG